MTKGQIMEFIDCVLFGAWIALLIWGFTYVEAINQAIIALKN